MESVMADHRKAPWLVGGDRDKTFDTLCAMAREGLNKRQMAERLGTNRNSLDCYMTRYGMTMAELREYQDAA